MSKNKIHRTGPGTKSIIKRSKNGAVDVGIIDAGEHDESYLTVAEIGIVHEYGAKIEQGDTIIKIPERSFFRSTLDEEEKKLRKMRKNLLKKIIKGEIEKSIALGLLGRFLSDRITDKIVELKYPENAESTKKSKGSDNPLIDNKQLANSITWRVR